MGELAILDALQGMHTPWLDAAFAAYTTTSDHGLLWVALGLALTAFKRTRWAGVTVLVALAIGAVVTSGVLKPLVMRPRPCDVNPAVTMIVPRPDGSSFPSGHTTAAFAAFGAVLAARNPRAPVALIVAVGAAAVLMAFTRLYAYVHYPTDVLGGIAVGLLAAFVASRIVAAVRKRQEPDVE